MIIKYAYFVSIHLVGMYGLYQMLRCNVHAYTFAMTWLLILFQGLSITAGYHRLWSHGTYRAAKALEALYIFFGTSAVQGSVIWWARDHKLHHLYTDTNKDPYNSKKGLFYSHLGWQITPKSSEVIEAGKTLDLKHLYGNPLLSFQHKHYHWLMPVIAIGMPVALSALWGDALGGLVVGFFFRQMYFSNGVSLINSLCHYSGTKDYDAEASSTNTLFATFITFGEGYHNYHHKYPYDYKASESLFCYNPTAWMIKALSFVGLTSDLRQANMSGYAVDRFFKTLMPELQVETCGDQKISTASELKLIIKHPNAVHVWFRLNRDPLSGLTQAYMSELLEVKGDFNEFMDHLIKLRVTIKLMSLYDKLCLYYLLRLIPYDPTYITPAGVELAKQGFSSKHRKHTVQRDKDAVAYHYDVGNDFYQLFLSDNMLYTSGLYDGAWIKDDTDMCPKLDFNAACVQKYKVAAEKLVIDSEHRVIDIGCGWGGFLQYMCKANPTIKVEGITISQKQVDLAKKTFAEKGIADRAQIRYEHYGELFDRGDTYDRIVVFQATEHMLEADLDVFFRRISKILKPNGRLLIEFMTTTSSKGTTCHEFFDRYIFPDGAQFPLYIPIKMAEKNKLELVEVYNHRWDYYKTIKDWNARLDANREKCVALVGTAKYLTWKFYLLMAEYTYKTSRSSCYTCIWKPTKTYV